MRIAARGRLIGGCPSSPRPPPGKTLGRPMPGVEAALEFQPEVGDRVVSRYLGAAQGEQLDSRRVGPWAHGAGRDKPGLANDAPHEGVLAAARITEQAGRLPGGGLDVA